jgi:hypothetical protein
MCEEKQYTNNICTAGLLIDVSKATAALCLSYAILGHATSLTLRLLGHAMSCTWLVERTCRLWLQGARKASH